MNPGILMPAAQYATPPRGLLSGPTPVPTTSPLTAFSPLHISNLALWLSAADARISGSSVVAWPDRTGRHSATVFSGSPTIRANFYNGLPAVSFNGSSVMLVNTSVHSFGLAGRTTVFAVIQAPVPGNASLYGAVGLGAETVNKFGVGIRIRQFNSSRNYHGYATKAGIASADAVSSVAVTNVRKICAVTYDGSAARFYLNGALSATVSNVPTTLSGSTTCDGKLTVGGEVYENVAYWLSVIDISEVLVFSKLLSDHERASVTNYLTDLYAPQ